MKVLIFASLLAIAAGRNILGEDKCTYGPAYWCKSLKSAHGCGLGAVMHCAKKVWPTTIQGSSACSFCKEGVAVVHEFLANNSTEQEIIAAIKEGCSLLGPLASECDSLVDTYGKQIIEIVAQYTSDPDTVCKMVGLCQSAQNVPLMKVKPSTEVNMERPILMMPGPVVPESSRNMVHEKFASSSECEICTFVVGFVDKFISKSSTQEEVEDALDKLCKLMPSSVSLKCQEIVNTFTPAILNLLAQYGDPKVVCSMLHLCSSSTTEELKKPVEMMPKAVSYGPACTACKFAVELVDKMLKANATEEAIIADLEKICDLIPNAAVRNEFKTLIAEYGRKIIALLLQELEPEMVCEEIGLCSKMKDFKMKLDKSGTFCSVCQFAIEYLDSLLKEKATQEEVENALKTVCNTLPTEFRSMCEGMVTEYVPYVIHLLETKTPSDVCKIFGVCQSTQFKKKVMKPKMIVRPVSPNGGLCEVCATLVGFIDNQLKNNATEAAIINNAKRVCSLIPNVAVADECKALVNEYGKKIIELLASELDPQMVCKEIGLCATMEEFSRKFIKSNFGCTVCRGALSYLEKALKDKATQAEIETLLKSVCGELPATYKSMCIAVVDNYLPYIISLLESESPDAICKMAGLCVTK